jgi:hypothetical protein
MKMATGLALVAVGAILAFAVTGHMPYFNIQVAGWVIMLTGVAGIVIPKRGYGWIGKRVKYQRAGGSYAGGHGREQPPYLMLDPGAAPPPGTHLPGDDQASAPPPDGATVTEDTVEIHEP